MPAADFTFCPFPSGNQQDRAATNDHQERSCSERIAIGYYGSPAIQLLGSGLVWPALIYACASGSCAGLDVAFDEARELPGTHELLFGHCLLLSLFFLDRSL